MPDVSPTIPQATATSPRRHGNTRRQSGPHEPQTWARVRALPQCKFAGARRAVATDSPRTRCSPRLPAGRTSPSRPRRRRHPAHAHTTPSRSCPVLWERSRRRRIRRPPTCPRQRSLEARHVTELWEHGNARRDRRHGRRAASARARYACPQQTRRRPPRTPASCSASTERRLVGAAPATPGEGRLPRRSRSGTRSRTSLHSPDC
mmetsp:Transcript_64096/g.169886  ORF Transcript_64096/g.169886 Transcript_64096/m.169886 type:complete len:205 (+) Transcript_64096:965-1579(+)